MRGKFAGLASPIAAPMVGAVADYEAAQVAPLVGKLCCQFRDEVIPQMISLGQRKRNHQDIAARAFFQGAFEAAFALGDGVIPMRAGSVDEASGIGALALFVGGPCVRYGALNATLYFAQLWDDFNKGSGERGEAGQAEGQQESINNRE